MATKSRWVNQALVFYDRYKYRWLDALGAGVHKYITDFMSLPVDDTTGLPTAWTCTETDAGTGNTTCALKDAQGGWLRIEAAGNEDDGANMQMKGESWKFTSGDPLYFGCKILVDEATQSDIVIGLADVDTSLAAAAGSGAFFRKLDGATAMYFVTEAATVEEATSVITTTAAATEYVLEFFYDGAGNCKAYVDGVLVATHSTTLPTTEMMISIEYLNGTAQSAKGLDVDYIRCIQIMN